MRFLGRWFIRAIILAWVGLALFQALAHNIDRVRREIRERAIDGAVRPGDNR